MERDKGPIYTNGNSYRARAEARQRSYRTDALRLPHGEHAHWLSEDDAKAGRNFILKEAHIAARERRESGKGVGSRTFNNMLSSQAMCFNIFAPLASRLELATEVLRPLIDGLEQITSIHIEYTPNNDVFGDQRGPGGVDCDLLIEGITAYGRLVQVVETKFVERDFSICGFRKSGRAKKGQEVCPAEVAVRDGRNACLYQSKKGYKYWQRTDEHTLLTSDALPEFGCPFGDQRWQLWVNLALAHEEAARRGAVDARLAVCVSRSNTTLLGSGELLEGFRKLLRRPESFALFDLEALLMRIQDCAPAELAGWAEALAARYGDI